MDMTNHTILFLESDNVNKNVVTFKWSKIMKTNTILTSLLMVVAAVSVVQGRTKLAALPERDATVIRLDNPAGTLIEEERILTLQKTTSAETVNKVDFSWKGVNIDADSIRLTVLDHPEGVKLLNVSYPPNEQALVWEIASDGDYAETARISYLLYNIDRLVTYKAVADKAESKLDFKSYLVLRNFSGEDFDKANVLLDYGQAFETGTLHEETKQMLFYKAPEVPITKIWTWDAGKLPWDPEQLESQNIGVPVSYRLYNNAEAGLGQAAMWGGKVRLFQDDGRESTIFLGEDNATLIPVGQKAELYIGDSRDIVVTQRKMKDGQINLRRNNAGAIVLYDTDEQITAKIENFKDSPAVLTMIQRIPGQYDIKSVTIDGQPAKYELKDAGVLEFTIELPARTPDGPAVKNLELNYNRINVR